MCKDTGWGVGSGRTSLGQGGRKLAFEVYYVPASLCDFRFISLPQFSYYGKGGLTQISRFPLSVRGYEQMFLPQARCGGDIMTSTFISSGQVLLGL